jgi:hypothetical protein
MHIELRNFLAQFFGVVGATLTFVILVSFASIPMNLAGHPGEARSYDTLVNFHLS